MTETRQQRRARERRTQPAPCICDGSDLADIPGRDALVMAVRVCPQHGRTTYRASAEGGE